MVTSLGGRQDWVPSVVPADRPSVARMYDYFLGGKDHFAVDRDAAEEILAVVPEARDVCAANRAFLCRTVRSMALAGIDQFVDLGAGIPARPSVHEVAREIHPDAAVVYVDNDAVVVAHNRALLEEDDRVAALARDLRDPDGLLDDPRLQQVLDLDRPVGVLFSAVLHFVDLPAGPALVERYVRSIAPGSRVAISAACGDGVSAVAQRRIELVYARASSAFVHRTGSQFRELFGGLPLEDPGIVPLVRTPTAHALAAVGVKRSR